MIVCGKGEERGRIYEWEVNSYLISNTLAVGELVGGWMECNNNPTIIYWGIIYEKGVSYRRRRNGDSGNEADGLPRAGGDVIYTVERAGEVYFCLRDKIRWMT